MPLSWRVKPVLPVTKLLGAVAVVVLVVAFGRLDPVQWFLAVVVAAGLTGWALRDLIRPVRLTADTEGLTVVAGLLTRRHVPWTQIERVRVDRRARFGLRNELLEVDAGEALYLFSAPELGAEPQDVADALAALRA
jgi:Bacterial PH domain